jgi:hypothetical protein
VRAWVGLEHLQYCTEGCFASASALAEEFGPFERRAKVASG